MRFGKALSFLSIACLCLSMIPAAEAAKKKAKPAAAGKVTGLVIKQKGKTPVAGASVHLASRHHHTKHVKKTATAAKATVAKKGKAHKTAAHHGGSLTASDGTFALKAKHGTSHLVVAHKKHVGSGHARAAAGASVTIRLHKQHHHHSGAATTKKKAKSKKAATA